MKINWKNAILAGIIGTVLFDLVGFILNKSWDIPGLLASKLGGGLLLGGVAHYSNGIAIAIIYAALAPSLFGPKWFRAVSFITAQTVLGVWFFMLPLLGTGIAGLAMDPVKVSLAYTIDTKWRNRDQFLNGREEVQQFLTYKWRNELDYRLKKELWSFTDNRISVKFFYEWRNSSNQWFRSYGNEQWEFNPDGLMRRREASINDILIEKDERLLID